MAVKYVKDFSFDKSFGYSGSTGTGPVSNKEQSMTPKVAPKVAPKAVVSPKVAPKVSNYDDSMPTPEEVKLMQQAREYKREDKATSDAAKREMGFKKGGDVKADLKQDKKMVATAVHKHEKAQHPGKPLTKLKKGGSVLEKATGERYASKSAMVKHEKTETPRMEREEMVQKRVVRGPAMAAGRDPRIPMLKCGGAYKK